ncbi:MAG: MFS transporter, partial [SAR202 cluster bacterium]|nr:MFS transporter [SAR202 cluster bacterium]
MVRTTRLNSFAKWLPPKPDLLWMGVAGITLVAFLLPVSSYVASLPVIQEQWGLNNTQAGVVYSTYLAGYALSALAIIPLTDRIGSRPVLFGAGLLSIVSHVLFPIIANSPVEAALLRAVQG